MKKIAIAEVNFGLYSTKITEKNGWVVYLHTSDQFHFRVRIWIFRFTVCWFYFVEGDFE